MEEDDEVTRDLDTHSKALYDRLAETRERLANEVDIYPGQLTNDCTLRHIALTQTATSDECMKLRKVLAKEYVKVVNSFQEELQQKDCEEASQTAAVPKQAQGEASKIVDNPEANASERSKVPADEQPSGDTEPGSDADETDDISAKEASTPTNGLSDVYVPGKKQTKVVDAATSSVEPIIHTGLSFSMATADIDDKDTKAGAEEGHNYKPKQDVPVKRKRSISPDNGRKLPAKSS